MTTLFIILAVIVVIVLWVILGYNTFVKLRNRTKEAWADIDVQLKRRYNLIPNLVRTVKGYMVHEQETFEKVVEARSKAMNAQSVKEKADAENFLSSTLKSLFALAENYPQLRATENFLELQKELRDTEDKIQAARRFYNGNVRDLNTKIESFPANVIAAVFGFKKMDLFELKAEEERKPVDVQF